MVTLLPSFENTDTHQELKVTLNSFAWGDYKSAKNLQKPAGFSETGDTTQC